MRRLGIVAGLIAGVAGLALYFSHGDNSASIESRSGSSNSKDGFVASVSDAGPEAALAKVFEHIENHRHGLALEQTEAILNVYPNFRLAHLIKGDLLLARNALGKAPITSARPPVLANGTISAATIKIRSGC